MSRAGLTPASVLDAAGRYADEHGYDALTLSALADTVGVRTPSLYKHVAGLDDLRDRLALRAFAELGAVMAAAVAGRERREALAALATAYRSFVRGRPGLATAAQRAPGDDAELRSAAAAATEALLATVRSYGIPSADEVVHLARFARSSIHGFTALEAAGGFGLPQSVEESFERLIDYVDSSLRAAA